MRLALFEAAAGSEAQLGAVTEAGVVALDCAPAPDAAGALKRAIAEFEELRPELERAASAGPAIPLERIRLLPPLAAPSKILCTLRRLGPSPDRPVDLQVFLRAQGAALGSGGEVVLPELEGADLFTANACVAVVIACPTYALEAANWRQAVFGYTALIDVTARTATRGRWKGGPGPISPLGSSCDSFAPLGPWIVPRSEVDEDAGLRLRLRRGRELRQDECLDRLDEQIGKAIERASSVMTLEAGDVIAIDGALEGQGPLQNGDRLELEMEGVGTLTATVRDDLRRRWNPAARIDPWSDSGDVVSVPEIFY